MEEKEKIPRKKSETIKEKLNALLKLNKKRKSALEKMSKSILGEKHLPGLQQGFYLSISRSQKLINQQ